MSVIWSGLTEEGAVVPVQVTEEGKVVVTANRPVDPTDGGGASAWGVFDGNTGVLSNGLNSSVVRNGTGDYAVTFTTPMPSANYSIQVAGVGGTTVVSYADPSATGFTLYAFDGGARTDPSGVSFAVFATNSLPPKGGTSTDAWGAVSSDGTLLNGFNVASVSNTGTGIREVVFTTPMPTENYAVLVSGEGGDNNVNYPLSATGFSYRIQDGGAAQDLPSSFTVNATNATLPTSFTRAQIQSVIDFVKRFENDQMED